MDNAKNKIIGIVVLFYLFLFFFEPVICLFIGNGEESTGPNDYARITDVDYKAILLDEPNYGGKVLITETLTFDIHAASQENPFWELWRDLPEDEVDGLKIDYEVLSVKEIHDDGSKTSWEESNKLYWEDEDYTSEIYGPGKWYHSKGPYNEYSHDYECVFFYIDGVYRDTMTFEIQYIMNNAALRYSDVSELYLTMYSEETIKHLKSFDAEILIPDKDMPKIGNYTAHTFGTNENTFEYIESKTKNPGYHTFSMNLDENDLKFKKYNQYLEFTLLSYNDDVHKFTDYAPKNIYSDDVYLEEALNEIKTYDNLPKIYKKYKRILFLGCTFLSIGIITYIYFRDKRIRKKHTIYETTQPIEYFRDIPNDLDPYFAATLVFAKDKKKPDIGDVYSAIMLSLVRKGYVELERITPNMDWIQNNILIKVLYKPISNIILSNNFSNIQNISNQNINNQINNNIKILNNNLNNQNIPTIIQKNKNYTIIKAEKPLIKQEILDNVRINEKGKQLEDLTPNEQAYFNLIIRHSMGKTINMSIFQEKVSHDYVNTNSFVTTTENSIINIGITQGYFQKANYNEIKKSTNNLANIYLILGLIILIFGNLKIYNTRLDLIYGGLFMLGITLIFSCFYLKKFANKYILFTQFGENEHTKWKALYNFLNNETLLNDKTIVELALWEKYLIYATAFGISDKVIKALEINCPNINVNDSPILSNRYYRSNHYRNISSSFRFATRHASSTYRNRTYGGYGGGGRGGGGGGGGH